MALLKEYEKVSAFVQNDRGSLIHRPVSVQMHKLSRWDPHLAVHYYCGGMATGDKKFTFLNDMPSDRLLCHACEARAVMAGLPSSSEICGRHIHTGKMVLVRQCCNKKQEVSK